MYYAKFCLSDSSFNYTKLLAKTTLRCNHPYIAIYIYIYIYVCKAVIARHTTWGVNLCSKHNLQ